MKGSIYLAKPKYLDDIYKIGMTTKHPEVRVSQIQPPKKLLAYLGMKKADFGGLDLLHSFPTDNCKLQEVFVHLHYRHRMVNYHSTHKVGYSEWFELQASDIAEFHKIKRGNIPSIEEAHSKYTCRGCGKSFMGTVYQGTVSVELYLEAKRHGGICQSCRLYAEYGKNINPEFIDINKLTLLSAKNLTNG